MTYLANQRGDIGPERRVPAAQPASREPGTQPQAHDRASSMVAMLFCGSLALAVGKTTAKKVPTPVVPQVRVRKRGKHHRTSAPVALPADVTVAEFEKSAELAEADTVVMPALTAAAAQLAEDQVFWGKISEIKDDEEISFWSDLHDAVAQTGPARTATELQATPG